MSNKKGFSLIEAIIALFIISIFMTAFFSTQIELMWRSSITHNYYENILNIKNYFIKADKNNWYQSFENKTESIPDSLVKLTYSVSKPKSLILSNKLRNKIDNLVDTSVTAEWPGRRDPIEEKFNYFKFKLPEVNNDK